MSETASVLPLIPLREIVPFPNQVLPIQIGRARSVAAIAAALRGDGRLLLGVQRDPGVEEVGAEGELHPIAVIAQIVRAGNPAKTPFGVVVRCETRVRLTTLAVSDDHLAADYTVLEETAISEPHLLSAAVGAARESLSTHLAAGAQLPGAREILEAEVNDPDELCELIALLPDLPLAVRLAMLEATDAVERLRIGTSELVRQTEVLRIQRRIAGEVRAEIDKNQRQFILREQMRAIQKELGEEESGGAELDELRAKLSNPELPEVVRTRAERELARLATIPAASPETAVVRTYLEWLGDLPWITETPDALDLSAAASILDEDHWGLEKPKERILEFLAVRKLAPSVKSPILCLDGPPGVGKTSLGRSVARAMGREFVRISLGGMHDEAEIRGHRRTYVGALPGRIIQALKTAKTRNPVFMLDEIDKLGSGFRGDPASALLEVLDPAQNDTFTDNYLEIPFDLSKVLFIATANVVENIPGPLLDRMEVISLPGYTPQEKLAIAEKYLVPRQRTNNGLGETPAIGVEAIDALISGYTREAGVRNLEREVGSLCRKVAKSVAGGGEAPNEINAADLESYLGAPRYESGELDLEDQIGTATGLVVTGAGGDVLQIETALLPHGERLLLTGQLGDVMRESARTALSWVEGHAAQLGIPSAALEGSIHLHVPAGAIPKDGPSAGVTIATAIASLLSGRPVRHDLAMTGEMNLRGGVLPIGGVKAKVLAAHRAGAKTVILPERNRKDANEELPGEIRESLEIRFVSRIEEVLEIALLPKPILALPAIDASASNTQLPV